MKKIHACLSPVTQHYLSRLYPKSMVIGDLPELNDSQLIEARHDFNQVIGLMANDTVSWWAHPLSEKNEHGFGAILFKRWCRVLQYMMIIKSTASAEIIIKDEEVILTLLNDQVKEGGYTFIKHDKSVAALNQAKDTVINLLRLLCWCGRFIQSRLYTRLFYRLNNFNIKTQQPVYLIRTWLDGRLKAQQAFKDSYFGDLSAYLIKKDYQVVVIAGIVNQEARVLKNLSTVVLNGVPIIPEHYFARCRDIVTAVKQWFNQQHKVKSTALTWMGLSIGDELVRVYHHSRYLSAALTNLSKVICYQRITHHFKPTTMALTFENYAWEKMVCHAIKSTLPTVNIVGFQHAFISANSFKYFSTAFEIMLMPKPDRIVTLGKITRDLLLTQSGWDKERVVIGCALRQPGINDKPLQGRLNRTVLVPLTMVDEETRLTLKLINAVDWMSLNYQVIIRPHPATDIKQMLTRLGINLASNIKITSNIDLAEDLKIAGFLCYTSSTVVLEALAFGIPCIYLDVLKPLQVNPVLRSSALVIQVQTPEKLVEGIKHIEHIHDKMYTVMQQEVKRYTNEYFYPVNEKNMEVFCL